MHCLSLIRSRGVFHELLQGCWRSIACSALQAWILVLAFHVLLVVVERSRVTHLLLVRIPWVVQTIIHVIFNYFPAQLSIGWLSHVWLLMPWVPLLNINLSWADCSTHALEIVSLDVVVTVGFTLLWFSSHSMLIDCHRLLIWFCHLVLELWGGGLLLRCGEIDVEVGLPRRNAPLLIYVQILLYLSIFAAFVQDLRAHVLMLILELRHCLHLHHPLLFIALTQFIVRI